MKKQASILAGIVIGTMLFGGCANQTAAVNAKPSVGQQQTKAPVIKAEITEKKIEEQTDALKTTICYPVISGLANTAIQEQLNTMFEKAAMDFKEEVQKSADQAYTQSKKDPGMSFHPYEVFIAYDVHSNKDHILSITSDYYQYTGGAHGGTDRIGYNIDLSTGQRLQLPDIFAKGFDYKAALSQEISLVMKQDPSLYFEDASGVIKEMADNRPFYIEEGRLVLYFNQYEIAPYAAGILDFKIPFEKLQLNPALGLQ
jgi:hypothetical protein